MLALVALVEALLAAASACEGLRRWCFTGATVAKEIPATTSRETTK
jgi:hypothetical protein